MLSDFGLLINSKVHALIFIWMERSKADRRALKLILYKMKWSNKNILKLIHAVKEKPLLWDASNSDYKNSEKKTETYENIGKLLKFNGGEVKRKWKILRGQFRRQKLKVDRNKKLGTEDNISEWYAYPHLMFLLKGRLPDLTSAAEPIENQINILSGTSSHDSDLLIPEDDYIDDENQHVLAETPPQFIKSPTKRKLSSKKDLKLDLAYSLFQEVQAKRKPDEYDLFGKNVAFKLRKIKNENISIRVQRDIDNLLYDALINEQSSPSISGPSSSSSRSFNMLSNGGINNENVS